ncbi:hypothetical protein [Bifidobacterium oedipodis]|uniref:Uncharacterized protein n=1 Tax=Bifidobacterium oedipodis TaxID=2675322 RepID=A0A7Y0HS93_9BIFI|nr:hypothetical protein [Bifidobacterium sp. DSM 109957]NMM93348.1 hypothetical protein [Bifidobacterium sp. DSM 109957]
MNRRIYRALLRLTAPEDFTDTARTAAYSTAYSTAAATTAVATALIDHSEQEGNE